MTGVDPGTSVHFRLRIDGIDLGDWSSCEGLGCEVEVEQHQEGGNNGFVWQLPSRVRYTNVTLTRPLIPDTAKVARFLATLPNGITRGTAQIAALRPDRALLVQWVWPTWYSSAGPARPSGPTAPRRRRRASNWRTTDSWRWARCPDRDAGPAGR